MWRPKTSKPLFLTLPSGKFGSAMENPADTKPILDALRKSQRNNEIRGVRVHSRIVPKYSSGIGIASSIVNQETMNVPSSTA